MQISSIPNSSPHYVVYIHHIVGARTILILKKLKFISFWGNKTVNQRLGAKLKKTVFLINFTPNLLLFCKKIAENYYFDQRLGCAALKRWSKYTTEEGVDFGLNMRYASFKINVKHFSSRL